MDGFEDGVSIITIVLNGESLIEETIKSVIHQKNVHIEYIIVDGGSTDKTLERIALFKEEISFIISEPDEGIYYAINKGISLAHCPLVGLIHCGDRYTPDAISLANIVFKETGADIVYGDIQVTEELAKDYFLKELTAKHELLRNGMSIFHPSTFVKRTCYLEIGVYDLVYRTAADYDLFLHFFLLNRSFVHIPKVLAVFQAGGTSSSHFFLSVKENFLIRKRRLGSRNAIKDIALRLILFLFFTARKSFIQMLVGRRRYFSLKKKYNNPSAKIECNKNVYE